MFDPEIVRGLSLVLVLLIACYIPAYSGIKILNMGCDSKNAPRIIIFILEPGILLMTFPLIIPFFDCNLEDYRNSLLKENK